MGAGDPGAVPSKRFKCRAACSYHVTRRPYTFHAWLPSRRIPEAADPNPDSRRRELDMVVWISHFPPAPERITRRFQPAGPHATRSYEVRGIRARQSAW